MMTQTLIALLLVAAAALYLGWRVYRGMRSGPTSGCAAGCGCSQTSGTDANRLGRRIDLVAVGTPEARAKESSKDDHAA